MKHNKTLLLKVVIFCLILFGVFVLFKETALQRFKAFVELRQHTSLPDYIAKVQNSPRTLTTIMKQQRDELTEELVELMQELKTDSFDAILKMLKEQRDVVGVMLNKLRQKIGKLSCEAAAIKENEVGGWCRNSSMEYGGDHMTDMKLVKALSTLFKGKNVGSFGDGPGAYKREIDKLGEVRLNDAYDGSPFCEETSEGRVKFLDLTVPQYGLPIYDWIISLEVAEHIPRKYEVVYIDNLVRHCKDGIVLSWAEPRQGGLGHVNERERDYVLAVMEQHGFKHDFDESMRLRQASVLPWLQTHISVFIRSENHYVDTLKTWFT